MGLFKMIAQALGMRREKARILVIGLDNSGKTTLINHLRPKKASVTEVVPTVGFQVEEFTKHGLAFTISDMSGQGRYRSLWEEYYSDVQAIVFVVDTTDQIRICVAKDELDSLLAHPEMASAPILLFANKMDLPAALSAVDCMGVLELGRITENPWHITESNAITGEGVDEGISWLAEHIRTARRGAK